MRSEEAATATTRARLARISAETWRELGEVTALAEDMPPRWRQPADDAEGTAVLIEARFPGMARRGHASAFITSMCDLTEEAPEEPLLFFAGEMSAIIHFDGRKGDYCDSYGLLDALERLFAKKGYVVEKPEYGYDAWDLRICWVTERELRELERDRELVDALCSGVPIDDLFA